MYPVVQSRSFVQGDLPSSSGMANLKEVAFTAALVGAVGAGLVALFDVRSRKALLSVAGSLMTAAALIRRG